jgi:hypothetical protein
MGGQVGGTLQMDAKQLYLFAPILAKAKKFGLLSIYKFSLLYPIRTKGPVLILSSGSKLGLFSSARQILIRIILRGPDPHTALKVRNTDCFQKKSATFCYKVDLNGTVPIELVSRSFSW